MKGYPRWFTWRFVSLILLSVFVTGLLLVTMTLELELGLEVPWRLSGTSRIAVTASHAFASAISLVLFGALTVIHMRQGWRKRLRRKSGVSLSVSFGLLFLTSLGIYYLGDETMSSVARLSHTAFGILVLPIYIWHFLNRLHPSKVEHRNPKR
jgi:hypothetical protein